MARRRARTQCPCIRVFSQHVISSTTNLSCRFSLPLRSRASSTTGGGGMSTLTMRRLQAPARHKLGSDQHQRRALWPPLRETAGRFGASQSFDWDRHRRPNVIARVHDPRFDYRVRQSAAMERTDRVSDRLGPPASSINESAVNVRAAARPPRARRRIFILPAGRRPACAWCMFGRPARNSLN